ncbi:hypothetical protein [Hymenobacter convexus]|uniref:hypothetical protein n=1 Tax=Hymenobacter sp. CA1UV-4 TaxID=3063782 RepID=UPI0027125453|nr:hypothetical protein [Hymenobacter sp. CA1UV-4]MDO7850615.1 hypothetical protein [Hymenobacter sp. CA1UV-4]
MAFPLQFFLETVVLPHLLMAKDKKKKHKKGDASEDILDVAALSIKKFRKVTREIGKLSTGQKLVGGIALVAAGLTYLATQDSSEAPDSASNSDEPGPLKRLADSFLGETEDTPAHRKPRKIPKFKPAPDSES